MHEKKKLDDQKSEVNQACKQNAASTFVPQHFGEIVFIWSVNFFSINAKQ